MNEDFTDELVAADTPELPERFFDRFMFNMHPRDATAPSIIMGLGHYPGRDVADGFAILTTGTEQRNVRFSTELSDTRGDGVGPLSFAVLQPNHAWRLRLGPNPTGMEYDVVWHARTPYWLGDVAVRNAGTEEQTRFDHLVQSGRYTGTLTIDGEQQRVEGWYGQRDRSRGVRTMSGGQGLHLWFQAQFPDRSVCFLLVENRQGGRLLLDGAVLHQAGQVDEIADVKHNLQFDALDLRSGTVQISTVGEAVYEIEADATAGGGLMTGGGYDGQHGRPRGRNHMEHDVYPLDGAVTQSTLGSSLTDRLSRFTWDGTPGIGIVEFALTRSPSYTYRPTLS